MSAPRIPDSATVVARADLLSSEFGEELILLNLRDGIYYGLDQVGTRIWELIKRPVTVSRIRDTIVSEYEVDPARCERDLRELLADLQRKGLIEVTERA
jgi:hypothetical protein